MKLIETLRQRSAFIFLVAPVLLLVVVAPFVENSNAAKAAEAAEAREIREVHAVAVAEKRAEEQAEYEVRREAQLAVMTCDELHIERESIAFPYSIKEQLYDEVLGGPAPEGANSEIAAALASSRRMLQQAAERNTAPIDAHIEERCPTS